MPPARPDRDGISSWRQIADDLLHNVSRGILVAGEKLPSAVDLAARYGVNRLTVMRAIRHLGDMGALSVEHGRGTFVTERALRYRLGQESRFEENVLDHAKHPGRRLLSAQEVAAPPHVATELCLAPDERVALVSMVSEADGCPVCLMHNYFPISIFPEILNDLHNLPGAGPHLRTSELLQRFGISKYVRRKVILRARPASVNEINVLNMPVGQYVVETDVTNVDQNDRYIVFGRTSYPASKADFVIDLK